MIHLNIGSNLKSKFGNKFQNISLAITLLIESEINILKISDFYETPSYPNKFFPKFINIGILISCNFDVSTLLKKSVAEISFKITSNFYVTHSSERDRHPPTIKFG